MTHFDGMRRLREQMNAPQRYIVLPDEQIVSCISLDGPIRDGLGRTIGYARSGRCVWLRAGDERFCTSEARYLRELSHDRAWGHNLAARAILIHLVWKAKRA